MNEAQIVREITERAWRFGVAVYLPPTDHVLADGLPCSGYFDGDSAIPILAVGWGCGPRRLGILLHEYSHLTQWAENCPAWRADRNATWGEWLDGKPVRNIRKVLANSRELEADCERRTIRLIRELDAPIDVERYAQEANSYIHFYNVMAETRKWYATDRRPYNCPEVVAQFSKTIDEDFSVTPRHLRDALMTCI